MNLFSFLLTFSKKIPRITFCIYEWVPFPLVFKGLLVWDWLSRLEKWFPYIHCSMIKDLTFRDICVLFHDLLHFISPYSMIFNILWLCNNGDINLAKSIHTSRLKPSNATDTKLLSNNIALHFPIIFVIVPLQSMFSSFV